MSSIKKNFALNTINTVSALLFPLITFPYTSRILLADGIGQIAFFQSIISYISLFSALGLPLYAIREIARVRDNNEKCSKTAIEIIILHAFLTLLGYIVVFILCITVTKIKADILLFLILSTSLFFTAIGATWFYQGIEDFKYITIRALVVRTVSLICLFLFVHEKSDLLIYATITVVAEVGGNIFNFVRLNNFVDKKYLFNFKELSFLKHLKPALKIFILNLTISIYVNLDSVMLGFLGSEQAVGYYAASTRLTKAILAVVSSLGTVLLPRFSNLIEHNRMEEFRVMAQKAINLVLALSIPLTVGLAILAGPIIRLFSGTSFEPAILTLQLISPILLMIALSGILGMHMLYPQGKESLVIISTTIGAVLNFSLNMFTIPHYAQYGAAFSTTIAESCVTISMIIIGHKYLPVNFFTKQTCVCVIGTILISIVLLCICRYTNLNDFLIVLIGSSLSICIYFFVLLLGKNSLAMEMLSLLTNIKRRLVH